MSTLLSSGTVTRPGTDGPYRTDFSLLAGRPCQCSSFSIWCWMLRLCCIHRMRRDCMMLLDAVFHYCLFFLCNFPVALQLAIPKRILRSCIVRTRMNIALYVKHFSMQIFIKNFVLFFFIEFHKLFEIDRFTDC